MIRECNIPQVLSMMIFVRFLGLDHLELALLG